MCNKYKMVSNITLNNLLPYDFYLNKTLIKKNTGKKIKKELNKICMWNFTVHPFP